MPETPGPGRPDRPTPPDGAPGGDTPDAPGPERHGAHPGGGTGSGAGGEAREWQRQVRESWARGEWPPREGTRFTPPAAGEPPSEGAARPAPPVGARPPAGARPGAGGESAGGEPPSAGARPAPEAAGGRVAAPVRRGHWQRFAHSPFLPATVLLFILAAAAGLFAGSYTYNMANPTPRRVPTAVVGKVDTTAGKRFVAGMEKALNASLQLRSYRDDGAARDAVEEQRAFAILRLKGRRVLLDLSSASGQSVAQVLQQAAPKVGKAVSVPVTLKDLKPLQKGDPRGLALFYISLAAVIVGFVGAIQLSVHARELNPGERVAYTVAHALLGGFTIAAVVDWLLDAIHLPFLQSWGILALTMFTTAMVFSMFNALIGRWAMIPTWGLMVLLGNPSSGGAVSWPLLPSPLGYIGQWLPPGASVNAQHTAVYFRGHQHLFPYLVLAVWALASTAVFWFLRHRHPGGRPVLRSGDREEAADGGAAGA